MSARSNGLFYSFQACEEKLKHRVVDAVVLKSGAGGNVNDRNKPYIFDTNVVNVVDLKTTG